MTLDQLQYILEIKRQGSITKAANALFMTQSALSMALTALEKELNLTIFERTPSGVVPTEHGHAILRYADDILHKVEEMSVYAQQSNTDLSETIKIITGPLMYGPIMLDVMEAVQKISRDIFLDIHEREAQNIANIRTAFFMEEKADFVFWGNQAIERPIYEEKAKSNGLQCMWLAKSQLVVYARQGHPLFDGAVISVELLGQYVLLATAALKKEIEANNTSAVPLHIYPINTFYNIERLLMKEDFLLIAQDFFGRNNPYVQAGQLIELSQLDFGIGPQNMQYMLLYQANHIVSPSEKVFLHCLKRTCQRFQ